MNPRFAAEAEEHIARYTDCYMIIDMAYRACVAAIGRPADEVPTPHFLRLGKRVRCQAVWFMDEYPYVMLVDFCTDKTEIKISGVERVLNLTMFGPPDHIALGATLPGVLTTGGLLDGL